MNHELLDDSCSLARTIVLDFLVTKKLYEDLRNTPQYTPLEARQKALYEQMRREKRHLYDDHEYVPAAHTDVAKHWRKA